MRFTPRRGRAGVDQDGHASRDSVWLRAGVLVTDAVLDGGVTQDFLLRRADLEPDYFGFRTASNQVGVGFGLAASNGTGRNLKAPASGTNLADRNSGKGRKKKA